VGATSSVASGSAVAVADGGGGGSVGAGAGWQAEIIRVNIKMRLLHKVMREYIVFIGFLMTITSM
jgi:hypothetical protein